MYRAMFRGLRRPCLPVMSNVCLFYAFTTLHCFLYKSCASYYQKLCWNASQCIQSPHIPALTVAQYLLLLSKRWQVYIRSRPTGLRITHHKKVNKINYPGFFVTISTAEIYYLWRYSGVYVFFLPCRYEHITRTDFKLLTHFSKLPTLQRSRYNRYVHSRAIGP